MGNRHEGGLDGAGQRFAFLFGPVCDPLHVGFGFGAPEGLLDLLSFVSLLGGNRGIDLAKSSAEGVAGEFRGEVNSARQLVVGKGLALAAPGDFVALAGFGASSFERQSIEVLVERNERHSGADAVVPRRFIFFADWVRCRALAIRDTSTERIARTLDRELAILRRDQR